MRGAYLNACAESQDINPICRDQVNRKILWEETEKCLTETLKRVGLPPLDKINA